MPEQPQAKQKAQQVADELRAAIKAGEYKPGAKLPSETVLAERYGVARGTIRDAFNKLHAEWLTEGRRGSGTYVRTFKPMRRNVAERLARKNWDAGRAIWETDDGDRSSREVVSSGAVDAPRHIASGFGLAPGAQVWRHRVRHFIDGRLIQFATSYLEADLVGDASAPLAEADILGIFALLRDLGRAPVRVREELRSRVPLTDETDALGVTGQTPVLLLAQTAFDTEGRPVVVTELVLDSSSYLLEYDFTV